MGFNMGFNIRRFNMLFTSVTVSSNIRRRKSGNLRNGDSPGGLVKHWDLGVVMGGSIVMGDPQNDWSIINGTSENMDDLGVPLF